MTLTYKRINIHGWHDIYQNALKTLEELTDRPGASPEKQIIYFPKEYYHGSPSEIPRFVMSAL